MLVRRRGRGDHGAEPALPLRPAEVCRQRDAAATGAADATHWLTCPVDEIRACDQKIYQSDHLFVPATSIPQTCAFSYQEYHMARKGFGLDGPLVWPQPWPLPQRLSVSAAWKNMWYSCTERVLGRGVEAPFHPAVASGPP